MSLITSDNPMDVLTEEEIGEIEHEIDHLPDRRSAAIDALKIVQAHRGWISDQSLIAIAELLGRRSRINWEWSSAKPPQTTSTRCCLSLVLATATTRQQ